MLLAGWWEGAWLVFYSGVVSCDGPGEEVAAQSSIWARRQGVGSVYLSRDVYAGFPQAWLCLLASRSSVGTAWLFQMGPVALADVRP